ncbi:MAG: capsule biosynthesis protein [Candidatus Saccharibacteria bacterium]|nr:capsule biosynthesis protein [Pseudorhodobacter sp.]
MTMKLKVSRFRIRKPEPAALTGGQVAPVTANRRVAAVKQTQQLITDDAFMPEEDDDGFGGQSFLRPVSATTTRPSDTFASDQGPEGEADPARLGATLYAGTAGTPAELDAIRQEGLTGRQLRMARRLAQKHDLPATSDFDAVRLLRQAGIDPLQRSALLELVNGDDEDGAEAGIATGRPVSRALTVTADRPKLPQTVKPAALPSTEVRAEQSHVAEVRRIQAEIVARRRRKLALMWSKIAVFVLLPTFVAGWYYTFVATPLYSTRTEFVIQQATAAAQMSSLFSGTSFATSQDSVTVQGYLQSQDVMMMLDTDSGFKQHFQDPAIDPIQRLPMDANNSATYALFKKVVKISYDPTEGNIKMEVSATTPEKAVEFADALLKYAETRVDQMTFRLRTDQEVSAKASFEDAQTKLELAQRHLVALQERFKTFNSEVEVSLITTQIGTLDAQLTQERLSLAQMQANAQPNQARMDPVITRIATLQDQIAQLRLRLTESSSDGPSIATVQSELVMAQADVATRQMMLAQATTAMETSRIEANRQTRYLSVAVQPVAPDDPSYPRAFENTLIVMLIFGGIYLMISMTIAILREQVSN